MYQEPQGVPPWDNGVYIEQETEEFRDYSEPPEPEQSPHKMLRERKWFQYFTFWVMIISILWIVGVGMGMRPSITTFIGFLALLIFYTGEYIAWDRPRKQKRERKPKASKTRPERKHDHPAHRRERGLHWKDV